MLTKTFEQKTLVVATHTQKVLICGLFGPQLSGGTDQNALSCMCSRTTKWGKLTKAKNCKVT